ncbi:MAG: D-amino acid aminotransferase [Pseudomonadota bacterium]|nr:D-amino acid aminotransferase [Pseudomonadota bacterium]
MIVYLNGEFLPLKQAQISVLDRGFLFADGVYEVIPVYKGRLFRLNEHLQRLTNSLHHIQLPNPLTKTQWIEILEKIISQHADNDQAVYLQVTRGTAKREHQFPLAAQATVFVMSEVTELGLASAGVKAISCTDMRWQRCDIKSIALLGNVLSRQHAVAAGATEAILIRDGQVTEGAASNVFIVAEGIVKTPPQGPFILSGITRGLILELLQQAQLPYQETPISLTELRQAEEIWLTSSTREMLPVILLDEHPVGSGAPGPIWAQTWQLYQNYKHNLAYESLQKRVI